MYKRFIWTIALLAAGRYAGAQEFTFSQAGLLRNALNPARVADMPEEGRASLAYRNQWYSADQPYSTLFASAEGAYRLRSEGPLRRLGGQLSFADDNLARGTIRTQWVQLAGSYTQSLDVARRHQLSVGLGLALQMRSLNAGALTFDNQFSSQTLGFDPTMASGESFGTQRQGFVQASAGLAYRFFASERLALRADVAFLGINSLRESFSTLGTYNGFTQKRRLSGTLSARYQTQGRLVLEPLVYYNRQGPAYESLAGLWVLWAQSPYARKNMLIGPGLFVRPGDAVIPGVRIEYDRLSAAATYDATYSRARAAARANNLLGLGGLGALELSLQYRFWFRRPADGARSLPCRAF